VRARAPVRVRAQGAAPARKIDLSFVKIGKVWKEGKKKGRKEGKLSTILTIEKAIKYCTCYVL
jgi:hypothetical protein